MNEILITIIVAVLGSNGLATVITVLINRHYQNKDKKDADLTVLKDAIAALSHDSYFRHCRLLMPKESITEAELENHNYLYNAYHSQGLNGVGNKMHEQILKKPVITEKEG